MPSKKDNEEYLTKSRIKEEYEFTDAMIRDFLPEPELTKPNPRYSSAGAPMKLWRKSTVEKATATDEFAGALERRRKRGERGRQVAEAKRNQTLGKYQAKAQAIKVRKISYAAVEERAMQDKETYEHIKGDYDADVRNAPEHVKKRWMVNYIRHNLTVYDRDLYDMRGKVGVHEGYQSYKNAVLDKIAEAYPNLAEECERQKSP